MSAPNPATAKVTESGQSHWSRSTPLIDLILTRLSTTGATRAELTRDLRPLTHPEVAPALWRAAIEPLLVDLINANEISETRGRLKATLSGSQRMSTILGVSLSDQTWQSLRDGILTARALGFDPKAQPVLKALANPDHLRALVVQQAFGLDDSRPMSMSKLRAALAVRALERAFGNQIKSGLGASGTSLASKPSRVLAGQLLKNPRDCGSDGKIIANLAIEYLGTSNAEAETLRLALLRRHFVASCDAEIARTSRHPALAQSLQGAPPTTPPAPVANDRGLAGNRPQPSARPDLNGFVREVKLAANRHAEGWPGNRKAFICRVWEEIKLAHPAWALTEIEFKSMLTEANRTGGLMLANADLKDKKHREEFEKSAIQYKNTVWHFVRIDNT